MECEPHHFTRSYHALSTHHGSRVNSVSSYRYVDRRSFLFDVNFPSIAYVFQLHSVWSGCEMDPSYPSFLLTNLARRSHQALPLPCVPPTPERKLKGNNKKKKNLHVQVHQPKTKFLNLLPLKSNSYRELPPKEKNELS